MDVLITPEQLAAELSGARAPVVLDVRWSLGGPPGRPQYLAAHIPTAVFVQLDTELAGHGEPTDGRHPLPSIDYLTRAARSWGINGGSSVVVYDDSSGLAAARAWWLLTYAGVEDVRILDGGLRAWLDAGGSVEDGETIVEEGDTTLAYGHREIVSTEAAAELPSHGVLLDARAGERYRGEVEPVDPRAGHVPGAISAPTTENLDEQGRFLDREALRARFAQLGIDAGTPVGVYCGSGVTAAHEIAALEIAGFSSALYPGSFSQWSNLADRAVTVGPLP